MKWTTTTNRALPSDLNPFQFFMYPILVVPTLIQIESKKANTGQKLDHYFKSNKLKHILNINYAYYDDDPYTLAWSYHAAAQYS